MKSQLNLKHVFLCGILTTQVARNLCAAGHEVHIVTAAPEFVFKRDIPFAKLYIRKVDHMT